MPKAKWDTDLTEADIAGADVSGGIYSGDLPRAGVYRFKLVKATKGTGKESGLSKITWFLTLDGTWKPEHEDFNGCPVWDHMPLSKSTAFRARMVSDALGVGYGDILSRTVHDADGVISKIGDLVLEGKETFVLLNVATERSEGYDDKLKIKSWLALPETKESKKAAEPEPDDDADSDKAAKPKKDKKKAKADKANF